MLLMSTMMLDNPDGSQTSGDAPRLTGATGGDAVNVPGIAQCLLSDQRPRWRLKSCRRIIRMLLKQIAHLKSCSQKGQVGGKAVGHGKGPSRVQGVGEGKDGCSPAFIDFYFIDFYFIYFFIEARKTVGG